MFKEVIHQRKQMSKISNFCARDKLKKNVVKDPVNETNSKKFNRKKQTKHLKNILEYLCTTHISFKVRVYRKLSYIIGTWR
jgi:histidyl-tRNA synthetase